eukprot:Rhum_TRINITY_DN16690_c0_g1::Rhum_TRINITY_DN16690_c0_g1_i1::g.164058::m.164058
MGKLEVTVVAARDLANQSTFGTSDPYVIVKVGSRDSKTATQNSTLAPKYDETFKFLVADEASEQLRVEVWDHNVVSDTAMGHYNLSLSGLVRGRPCDEWYLLNGTKSGEIHLRVLAVDFGQQDAYASEGYAEEYYGDGSGDYQQKTRYADEVVQGETVEGATLHSVEVVDCTLIDCKVTNATFKGTNTLMNCKAKEVLVQGVVTVRAGRFEYGKVTNNGQLINEGDADIRDIENYDEYGY